MTVTYNIYRRKSTSEPKVRIATGLISKTFTDTTAIVGNMYLYSIGAMQNGVEQISSEVSIRIDVLTITATFATDGNLINGTSLKNANIAVTIDPDLSAHFSSDGTSMSGKSLANAQITVTI